MADTTTPNGDNEQQTDDTADEAVDWKAKSREWERRAKDNLAKSRANEDAARRLTELEEAQKTEVQKLTDRAETAEKALADSKSEQLRLQVAANHGITGEHLDLLSGATEEELEARAVKIAALTTPKQEDPPTPEKKKGAWGPFDPEEGGQPTGPGSTADQFAAAVSAALD